MPNRFDMNDQLYLKEIKINDPNYDKCSNFNELKNLRKVTFEGNVSKIKKVNWPYSLKKVIVNDGVTEIGTFAFEKTNIFKVSISKSVKKIGYGAFEESNIEKIELPYGLEEIGDNAFKKTTRLRNFVMPDSVTKIGFSAFSESWLNELKIGNSVKTIGDKAFYKTLIHSVEIPSSVEAIGIQAFSESSLFRLKINGGNLQQIGQKAFKKTYIEELKLPDNTEITIGEEAFSENFELNSVTIGNWTKKVSKKAFANNPNLTYATIKGSTEIEAQVFENCPKLKVIDFEYGKPTMDYQGNKQTVMIRIRNAAQIEGIMYPNIFEISENLYAKAIKRNQPEIKIIETKSPYSDDDDAR